MKHFVVLLQPDPFWYLLSVVPPNLSRPLLAAGQDFFKGHKEVDCDFLALYFHKCVLTYRSGYINTGSVKVTAEHAISAQPALLLMQLLLRYYDTWQETQPKLIFNCERMPINKPYVVQTIMGYWQWVLLAEIIRNYSSYSLQKWIFHLEESRKGENPIKDENTDQSVPWQGEK